MGIVREEDIQFWYTGKNLWKSGVEMDERQQGECRKLIQTAVLVHVKTLSYVIVIAAYCIYSVLIRSNKMQQPLVQVILRNGTTTFLQRWRKVVAPLCNTTCTRGCNYSILLLMMGAMDTRNMKSKLAVNNYLHTVASCWILLIQSHDAR